MRDEETRNHKHEDAEEEGDNVDKGDEQPVELHRNSAHVIGLGIEFHESREVLQGQQTKSQCIAPQQSAADDEHGKPHERVADGAVARPQGFEHLSCLCVQE